MNILATLSKFSCIALLISFISQTILREFEFDEEYLPFYWLFQLSIIVQLVYCWIGFGLGYFLYGIFYFCVFVASRLLASIAVTFEELIVNGFGIVNFTTIFRVGWMIIKDYSTANWTNIYIGFGMIIFLSLILLPICYRYKK